MNRHYVNPLCSASLKARITLLLPCLLLLSSCAHLDPASINTFSVTQGQQWPDQLNEECSPAVVESPVWDGNDGSLLAERPPYQVVRRGSVDAPTISLLHNGTEIYKRTVRYFESAFSFPPGLGLAYGFLSSRSEQPQPKPFDDILGNGLPDLVITEFSMGGTAGVYSNMLSIISVDGTSVVETPVVPCFGEIFYFMDFDSDGSLEIVNTDWEQGFRKFDPNGVSMHRGVWKFDSNAGLYRETGTKHPNPPNTWPAYRNEN